MEQTTSESRMRTALFGLAAFIFAGTLFELVLIEHTAESTQWIPFVLCALGIISILVVLARPARTSLLVLRGVMGLNLLGGLLGVALHLSGNYAFESEIRPNADTLTLLVETLKGANPLLAPGMLAFVALMVLIATYAHPSLQRSA